MTMNFDLMTKSDLHEFKLELVSLITEIVCKGQPFKKEILTNQDVKDLLCISSSTLRKYRVTGKLSYTKVDNILYYKYDDVIKFIESNSRNSLDRKY